VEILNHRPTASMSASRKVLDEVREAVGVFLEPGQARAQFRHRAVTVQFNA
jgi:hypothetical protein